MSKYRNKCSITKLYFNRFIAVFTNVCSYLYISVCIYQFIYFCVYLFICAFRQVFIFTFMYLYLSHFSSFISNHPENPGNHKISNTEHLSNGFYGPHFRFMSKCNNTLLYFKRINIYICVVIHTAPITHVSFQQDAEVLDISHIRDTRTGKYAKIPKVLVFYGVFVGVIYMEFVYTVHEDNVHGW